MVVDTAANYIRQGQNLKQNGRVSEAIDCYLEALKLEPTNPWYYYELGNLKANCHRFQEALHCYRVAIQLKPDFHGFYHKLGQIHLKNKRLDKAINCFRKALKYNNSNPWYYDSLGSVLQAKNQWEGAIYCYQNAIRLKPDFAEFYYKLGRSYHYIEQYELAIANYQQDLDLNSNQLYCYYYLGRALEDINLIEKANVYYQKSLEINHNFYPAYQKLGDLLCRQDRLEEALVKYKRARYTRTLKEYPEFAPWPHCNYLVNHEYQFIYCPIPKVACSSFKKLILQLSNHQSRIQQLNGVDFHVYVDQTFSFFGDDRAKVTNLLQNQAYLKFAIVRNPWNRLISAYLNKFVILAETFTHEVIDAVYQTQGLSPDYEKSITFQQFVNYLMVTEDYLLNEHWKPQFLFLGNIDFDFIGKFENLEQDFKYLQAKLNIDAELNWMNKTEHVRELVTQAHDDYANYYPQQLRELSQIPSYKAFYNQELIDLVYRRYQKDAVDFGYAYPE